MGNVNVGKVWVGKGLVDDTVHDPPGLVLFRVWADLLRVTLLPSDRTFSRSKVLCLKVGSGHVTPLVPSDGLHQRLPSPG